MAKVGHSTIVNVGSTMSIGTFPWQSTYNASKFALKGYTDTLRYELKPLNIQVVLIISGGVETKILNNSMDLNLPLDSVYDQGSWEKTIELNLKPTLRFKTYPEGWARSVVNQLIRQRPVSYSFFLICLNLYIG